MNKCKTCNPSCFNQTPDGCVYWTGPSMECVRIESGQSYDIAVVALAEKLCEIVNQNANLSCLVDDNCKDQVVDIPQAVQCIIDRICTLNSDQITTNASLFCVGENSSNCSANLTNRILSYSFSANDSYTNFNWDLSNTVTSLDTGYSVLSSSVIVYGTTGKSSTIINSSDKLTGGIRLQPRHFPATAEVRLRVGTPCGTVELSKNIGVSNTTQSFTGILDSRDLSGSKSGTLTIKEYQESLASEVCILKTKLESLDNINVPSCSGLTFPSNDINSILQVLVSKICELEAKIADPGSLSVGFTSSSSACGSQVSTSTLSEALSLISNNAASAQNSANTNSNSIEILQNQSLNSSTIIGSGGSSTTGGTTTGGGCSGGRC